ncbi:MAG: hypothetical protein SCH71_05880 [Desulfobulbaceae bacterium]|nr:hypothetical protein [Desulfobulbaceae bacterium]
MIQKPLSIELAASLCGVSPGRARKWIDKHGLKAVQETDGLAVNAADLINFLVKYNMPIPDAIVPKNTKKILFVYREGTEDKNFLRYLIGFIRQIRKTGTCIIADHVPYGPDVQMKIMVFKPDLILLDAVNSTENVIAISRFVNRSREFNTIQIIAYSNSEHSSEYLDLFQKEGVDEVTGDTAPIPQAAKKILQLSKQETATESSKGNE